MYYREEPERFGKKQRYYAVLGKELRKQQLAKEASEKHAKQAGQRMMTSLEWFIIGIIMHPIVGPLYHLAIHRVESMVPQ